MVINMNNEYLQFYIDIYVDEGFTYEEAEIMAEKLISMVMRGVKID